MDLGHSRHRWMYSTTCLVLLICAAMTRAQEAGIRGRILDVLRKGMSTLGSRPAVTNTTTTAGKTTPTTPYGRRRPGPFSVNRNKTRFRGLRRLKPRRILNPYGSKRHGRVKGHRVRRRLRRGRRGVGRGGGNFTCAGCGKASHIGENVKKRVDDCADLVKKLLHARPDVDGYLDNRDFCIYCGGRIAGPWEKALVFVIREPAKGRVPAKKETLRKALAAVESGKPVINLPKGPLKRLDKLIDLDRKLDESQKEALRKARATAKQAEPKTTAGAIGTHGSRMRRRIHFRRKIVYGPKGKRRTVFTPYKAGSRRKQVYRAKGPYRRRRGGGSTPPFGLSPYQRRLQKLRRSKLTRSQRRRLRQRRGFPYGQPAVPTGPIRFVCSRCGKQTVFSRGAKAEALEGDLVACERLIVQLRLEHPEIDLDMDTGSLCRDCNPDLGKLLNEKLGDRFTFKGEAPKLILNVRAPRAGKLPVNAPILEAVLRLAKDKPLRDKSLEKQARRIAKVLGF